MISVSRSMFTQLYREPGMQPWEAKVTTSLADLA